MKEQRRHVRYEVKDGTLILLGPYSAQIGQIVDMGHGGLSFHYKGNKNITKDIAIDPCEVSIVFDSKGAVKYGPFKFTTNIVSDVEVEDKSLHNIAVTNRCQMEFNDLSYHQKLWLEECLRNHTTGPVKPSLD
jgi:hypothetical protein